MVRPDSKPHCFPGLPGLRNEAACLPGPARAPTQLPSPAPNPFRFILGALHQSPWFCFTLSRHHFFLSFGETE